MPGDCITMPYRYSEVDRRNLGWFERDVTRATLLSAELRRGSLRGLQGSGLRFRYPITAIAGRNGTGKTTALALVACAYHNEPRGYNPLQRKHPYYTFSEFFIQTSEEVTPQGITIAYEILYDRWRPSPRVPEGKGRGWQYRSKPQGGKWSDYSTRALRNVIFYGIDRIVPATERSVYRSYRRYFRERDEQGWENDVRLTISRILGKPYDKLWFKDYRKYTLPMMQVAGRVLSGFNMGAGENALVNILSGVLACKERLLVVIDEIELGLHEEAQLRLIKELKSLCDQRHIQIVCTTHSPAVIGSLPPEGRLFLEDSGRVLEGISVDYAAGRLSGNPRASLDILVEDEVAKAIVNHSLQVETRARVRVLPVGSSTSVVRQLAARRRDPQARETIAFLDGDMSGNTDSYIDLFLKAIETVKDQSEEKNWLLQRLGFLPGDAWPERWVISTLVAESDLKESAKDLGVNESELRKALTEALLQHRHEEYHYIASALALDEAYIRERLAKLASTFSSDAVKNLTEFIESALHRAST